MKKTLLIFDLNHTLLYVAKNSKIKSFDYTDKLSDLPSNTVMDRQKVYFRTGRNEFLDFLFMKNNKFFEVGVWSSQDNDKTSFLAKAFFERYYRNLQFVIATPRQDYEGIKETYNPEPIAVRKNLNQLFEKFPEHDLNNTIVISNFKNLSDQYQANDLILPAYTPNNMRDQFLNDTCLLSLSKYLKGVHALLGKEQKITDIRVFLNSKSFNFINERVQNNINNYNEIN